MRDLQTEEDGDDITLETDIMSILPVVRRRVLVFLHIFSGHRREGDLEDWLTKLGCEAGVYVMVICADLGYGDHWDLTKKKNLRALKARADAGEFHGKHGGPPCSTWSAARWLEQLPAESTSRA